MLLTKQGVITVASPNINCEKSPSWLVAAVMVRGGALSSKLIHAILEIKNHLREKSESSTNGNNS